jgi:PAS domain S-box-containing protein
VAVLDIFGKILYMNKTLEELTGYKSIELEQLSYSKYMSFRGVNTLCNQLKRIKSNEIDSFQLETLIYPKNGIAFWGYMVVSSVYNIYGIRECLTFSLVDISDIHGLPINKMDKLVRIN